MKKFYPFLSIFFLISVCNSQNKVNVNGLIKHKNKYFKKNDYVPFDGIVFDVSKKTRNMILQFRMLNGLKNGPYEEWYASGKPKTTGGYFNDDSTDSWTKWYESGQKQSEKKYKDGKNDGLWTKWYESGQKQSEKKYKDGVRDGLWIEWYENGQKEIESFFQDGKERGLVTEWYENGLKREERTFKQFITYTENGLNRSREIYKRLFTYYNNGNIKEEKNYRNGKEWGFRIMYHDNGVIKYKNVNYKKNGDGKTYLIFTRFDKYGKLIQGDKTWWDGFYIKSGECYKDNKKVDCYAPN